MTRHTPATASTPDALAAIDATVDGRCACGCWANLQRLFRQIQDQRYPARSGQQVRCGQTIRDTMDALGGHRAPPTVGTLFGIPVVVDESMPPNRWRLVDAAGNVLHEGGT